MDGRGNDAAGLNGDWTKSQFAEAERVCLSGLGYDPGLGLFDAFLRVCRTIPDAPAILCGDRRVSYAELRAAAAALASRLALAGVRRGDRIGLLAERGVEPIVAMLGAARIGAAYVPLVPSYHQAQIGFIARDVGIVALVHARGLDAMAAEIAPGTCPLLAITGAEAPADLAGIAAAQGDDIAYVLYTSGSTGRPKGVAVRHCGISRIVHDQSIPLFRPGERILHCCTLAGDISEGEIWGALLSGASLAVVEEALASVDSIAQTIERHRVDVATFYAGIFHLMVESRPEALARLRIVTAGGDTMSAPHVTHLRDLAPRLTICNMYGPTETTIFTHLHEVTSADLAAGELPLGFPIAGTECFVIDEALRDVPAGIPGQCAIAGRAVAAGYLNQPELSAEKFIDDPRPGRVGKVYLTGDVVMQRPDGNLVFHGRVDRQIKLGGRRIELDEIEAALRRSPLLADAAVSVLKAAGRECRIAAFLKPADPAIAPGELQRRVRADLARDLPDTMLPRLMRVLPDLPLAGNGKVDRKRLVSDLEAELGAAGGSADGPTMQRRPDLEPAFAAPRGALETYIAECWCAMIGLDRVGRDDRFFELGGTSLTALRFLERLRADRGIEISVATFFDGPTIRALAASAAPPRPEAAKAPAPGIERPTAESRIAIVGLGGRFAGAADVPALWDMLLAGRSGRVEVTREDLIAAGEDPALLDDPDYVPVCYPLDEAESFDAAFFGFNPREVELMDPQQRILLETAWSALEDAGIDPRRGADRVGVFAGVGRNAYLLNNLMSHPHLRRNAHDYSILIGNERDFPAAHIAYRLGLRGPAVTVQTACSTSGVAIHMAAESLRRGECDLALAGGAKILVPNRVGYHYTEGGPLSPDGFIRAFDARAGGMVRGSGAAVIAMKRLDEALAAGDHVYAVLIGSSLNNDGDAKAGFTAPSASGQAAVIAEAYRQAGIDAASVSLIEAHGTGTDLGDPIEVEGLTRVFRDSSDRQGFCALGSIKTNIGHLDAGATAAGVIKAVLSLAHEVIPPSLNFERANPRIDWDGSPFTVAAQSRPWTRGAAPRRAGISSFGLGGTNAHIVLEEAPAQDRRPAIPGPHLILLSARSDTALARRAEMLADWLERHPGANLADVAQTLLTGRRRFEKRLALVVRDSAEAIDRLRSRKPQDLLHSGLASEKPPLTFMFPGTGAQYKGMARGLYDSSPVFRDVIDACSNWYATREGIALTEVIFAEEPDLTPTGRAMPAIFAVSVAMARLWQSWGVTPDRLIGHSLGEYAAAHLAGTFTLEDALTAVHSRATLLDRLERGAMIAVPRPAAEIAPRLGADLAVATINRPDQCVIAGPVPAIEALAAALTAEGIEAARLNTSVALHSPMVEPILEAFRAVMRGLDLKPPRIPFISCLTGQQIAAAEATDPDYWVRHLRQTVRFADGLACCLTDPQGLLVEIGPGQTLSAFARQHPGRGAEHEVMATIRHPKERVDDRNFLLAAAGRFWLAGGDLDRAALDDAARRRVPLPGYPFERKRHWIDALAYDDSASATMAPVAELPAPEAPGNTPEAAPASRRLALLGQLTEIIHGLSGLPVAQLHPHATFLELGFDSLFLSQANAAFNRAFKGVKLSTRQLMETTPSLDTLAGYLDDELPAAPMAAPEARPGPQLATRSRPKAATTSPLASDPEGDGPAALRAEDSPGRPGPRAGATGELTAAQEAHIDALIAETNRRTPMAKAQVQAHRQVLADPRTVQGFRQRWKEMVYPVLSDRAQGSKIWDLDGNEYVDLVGGYGVSLLGHAPRIVTEALRAQIDRSLAIGPQTVLAGEVARLVSDLTGMARVGFCNTGSEAVLAAVRTARTVTGKSRIVKFDGHYHGIFDEMQVRGLGDGRSKTVLPAAPGITPESIANTIVLTYGDPQAFEVIRDLADEIAVVLVEPVRSRNPDYQPRAYLQELRRVTEDHGIALLFDEMITGFRSHPGGAQALFGVRADLATYGKVAGGGLPIGIVGGSAAFMDALDGGMWQFGDESAPTADMTWFAGTFVRHPLSLAAAKAVLGYLKSEGPQLQEGLNAKAAQLADALNAEGQRLNAPIRVERFSSVLRITFTRHQDHSDLLFFHLRNRGVLTYEGRPIFLTTAHDEADYRKVVAAFRDSLGALVSVGLIEGRDPEAERRLPLTAAQQEIWISAQLGAESSCSYNLCSTLELKGALDAGTLQLALGDLSDRHEALRSLPDADGTQQIVLPRIAVPFAQDDLSGLAAGRRAARLEHLRQAEVRTPFDLLAGPLVRARLIRLGPAHHLILLNVHHVIADGWSCGVLMRELGELYAARQGGRAPALPPAQQLSDFVDYLHHPDQIASHAKARDYWLGLYAEGLPQVEFPADHPRPKTRDYKAIRTEIPVPPDLTAALRRLVKAQGSTLFAALIGGFAAYVGRLTGAEKTALGFAAAGQPLVGGTSLVGHCVNFLPLLVATDPDQGFGSLVKQIGSTVLDALEHQNYDFVSLVEELQPERNIDWAPILTVAVNLDPSAREVAFAGLDVVADSVGRAYEQLDIFINFVESGDLLTLQCTFNETLFDRSTMARRMGEYLRLLAAGASDPSVPLAKLDLIAAEDRNRLLAIPGPAGTANGADPSLRAPTLPGCFRAVARRWPDKTALVVPAIAPGGPRAEMSYARLDRLSEAWAARLQAAGVGRGDFVGLLLHRSMDFAIAALAVLKAGAAYVPIEPGTPKQRCEFVIGDSRARALLTHSDLAVDLDAGAAVVLRMDSDPPDPAAELRIADPGGLAEDAAYMMYTSGSTGQPKGVVVPHRGVTRLIFDNDFARIDETRAIAQITAVGFDLSIYELWSALAVGGALVLPPGDQLPDLAALKHMLMDGGVTALMISTAIFNAIIDEEPSVFEHVEEIIVAGEAMSALHVRRAHAALPDLTLINGYGPTEGAVIATAYRVPRDLPKQAASLPIGAPLNKTEVYVVDQRLALLPPGVPGELVLGGELLALGYWRRPDLTAAAFLPDTITGRADRLLYRTGDIGRLREDGTFDCLGRRDNQIKLRGVRIELGEIEAVLASLPGIRSAAMDFEKRPAGDGLLTGFVVAEPAGPSEQQVMLGLRHLLPRHFLPSRVIQLDAMPVNKNGKIDRAALRRLRDERLATPLAPVALTPMERALQQDWADILGRPVTSIDDSFFDLGGHSLMAVRLMNRIRRDSGLTLPIGTLFEHPTIRELAQRIESQTEAAPELAEDDPERDWDPSVVVERGPGTTATPLFIVGGAGGNLNNLVQLTREIGQTRAVIGFQSRGVLGHTPHRSIPEMAADNIRHMRRHQSSGPYRLMGFSAGALCAFEMARQLESGGDQVADLVLLDCAAPNLDLLATTINLTQPAQRDGLGLRLRHETALIRDYGWRQLFVRYWHILMEKVMHGRLLQLSGALNPSFGWRIRTTQNWYSMSRHYDGGGYGGRVLLVVSTEDRAGTTRSILDRHPNLGWEAFVPLANISRHEVSTTHLMMVEGQEGRKLARAIELQFGASRPLS